MSSAGITADQLEFSANRTLAYAILATEAPNDYLRLYRMSKVLSELRKVLPLFTLEVVKSLAERQRNRLALCLQDTYNILADFSGSGEADRIVRRSPLLRAIVVRCQKGTEDLADVLEQTLSIGGSGFEAVRNSSTRAE